MTGSTFDWVTARANCSMAEMFFRLRKEIVRDVATRNRLPPPGTRDYSFRILEAEGDRDDEFTIIREGGGVQARSVRIAYTATEITIGDVRANVTLNREGTCQLVVDGQELESWQVRRLALERLFFQD